MGILLCQACVFSILQTSLVLSAVQLICWPLDWVGLRRVRIAVTHVYAHAMGQSFVLWMEHIVGSTIVVTGTFCLRTSAFWPCATTSTASGCTSWGCAAGTRALAGLRLL